MRMRLETLAAGPAGIGLTLPTNINIFGSSRQLYTGVYVRAHRRIKKHLAVKRADGSMTALFKRLFYPTDSSYAAEWAAENRSDFRGLVVDMRQRVGPLHHQGGVPTCPAGASFFME